MEGPLAITNTVGQFDVLATVNLRDSNYVWVIHPRLGDTNNYRIKLSSVSFPGL